VEEEAFLSLARTAAAVEHRVARVLKPHGLTLTQYNVLRILRGAGAEGLCRNEVGERLVRKVPDVTRLLDRMEQTGLIARKRGATDRRYVTTGITDTGLRLVNALDDEVAAAQREQFAGITEGALREMIELLEKVRDRG
jgi:DNA-binding MarR family transcriptional regulator